MGRYGALRSAVEEAACPAFDVTRVPNGTPVRFPNEGRTPHNAVAVDGTWRTPDLVGADKAATIVLDQPGVYRFYCTFDAPPDGRRGMAATMSSSTGRPGPASSTGRSVAAARPASAPAAWSCSSTPAGRAQLGTGAGSVRVRP